MIVCFVRHGRAEEKKPGQSDFDRRLTEEGRREIEILSKVLPIESPVTIYTSPYKRAVESAEILSKELNGEVVVLQELAPDLASIDRLRTLSIRGRSAVFVGHAPSIEKIVSELIGGGNVKLKTGSAACVDIGDRNALDRSIGVLIYLVVPRYLERIVR